MEIHRHASVSDSYNGEISVLERIQSLGLLVDPQAIGILGQMKTEDAQKILESLRTMEKKPLVLDAGIIDRLLMPEPKLLKRMEITDQFSISDLAAAWSERFSFLRGLLLRYPEMNSVASINSARGRCAVIGQVRIKNQGTGLEDPTGLIEVSGIDGLLPDDVIGAVGTVGGGIMKAEEKFFPDIQMKETGTGKGKVGFKSGNATADYLIDAKGTEWWQIGDMVLLVHETDWDKLSERLEIEKGKIPVEMLKRRYLFQPPKDIIEPVPDIFVALGFDTPAKTTYRGVMIILCGRDDMVDLERGEAISVKKTEGEA